MISIYCYCWWVEDVSFQSPLVGPYINTHRVVKGPHFEAWTRPEPDIYFWTRFRPESQINRGS